jgi:hypothetical protein
MLKELNEAVDLQEMDVGLRNRLVRAAKSAKVTHALDTAVQAKAGRRDVGAEPEGIIHDPRDLDSSYHSSTQILCKDIADLLTKHYSGWLWAVQPNASGQIINVFCLNLHSMYGYTIRMADIMDDPRRKEALRAGGEILSRFGMPHRFDAAALAAAPRDMAGNCIPDISDFKSKKRRREAEIARKLATGEWMIVEADGHRYLRAKK